jgi:hypothetical protein
MSRDYNQIDFVVVHSAQNLFSGRTLNDDLSKLHVLGNAAAKNSIQPPACIFAHSGREFYERRFEAKFRGRRRIDVYDVDEVNLRVKDAG